MDDMALAPSTTPSSRSWISPGTATAVITIAVVLAYANSLSVPFVFDDEYSITANPTLSSLATSWSPPSGHGFTVSGRPLLNFSFALNHAISGTQVWSYHGLNLLIHLGAALALFGIVRRTLRPGIGVTWSRLPFAPPGRADTIALAAALLWALHPLQTEAVTYTVQRAESLSGLFLLLTLACFVRALHETEPGPANPATVARGADPGRDSGIADLGPASATPAPTRASAVAGSRQSIRIRWLVASVGCCLLGVLTKETLVVAPVLVALYDRTFVAAGWREVWRRRRWYYAVLFATWIPLALLVATDGARGGTFDFSTATIWRYALTQPDAVTHYVRLALWPTPLAIDYGTFWVERTATILPAGALVVLLLASTLAALRRWPAAGFLGSAFFLTLAPSSLAPGTVQMIVEHRMYVPLAALVVLILVGVDRCVGQRGFVAIAAAIALALGLATAARNTDYTTPIRLFQDTVAKRPQNARAMALLADYERRGGQNDAARRWLERSLEIDPSPAAVWNNLGDIWQELGQPAKAVPCFERALARNPSDSSVDANLANALVLAGRGEEGVARLEKIVQRQPHFTRARSNLANALARSGRMEEASEQFASLVSQRPRDLEVRKNYADVLIALHRVDEAIEQLRAAAQLEPASAENHMRIGIVLGRAGRLREALPEFEEAVRLNPTDEVARQNLAIAQQRLGLGR